MFNYCHFFPLHSVPCVYIHKHHQNSFLSTPHQPRNNDNKPHLQIQGCSSSSLPPTHFTALAKPRNRCLFTERIAFEEIKPRHRVPLQISKIFECTNQILTATHRSLLTWQAITVDLKAVASRFESTTSHTQLHACTPEILYKITFCIACYSCYILHALISHKHVFAHAQKQDGTLIWLILICGTRS